MPNICQLIVDVVSKWCYYGVMKQSSNTKKIRKTSLRMPESLANEVDVMAKEDSRSFNTMVNVLVEKAVSQRKKDLLNGTPRSGS